MRKLSPARVSYRNDFLISYRFYMMTGSFHISLFEGTLHVDKIHVWFKIANITHAMRYPFQSTSRPISHRNEWSDAARLAQLEERWSAEREVVSSNPGRTISQGLYNTGEIMLAVKLLSQYRWSRHWAIKLSRWSCLLHPCTPAGWGRKKTLDIVRKEKGT